MNAIQRNGGSAGFVTAALFVILLVLSFSLDPSIFSDPERALAYAREQGTRRTAMGVAAIAGALALAVFVAGLADRLHPKTPTRGAMTYLFGLIGAIGLAFGSLVDWLGIGYLVGTAARDEIAVQHAWYAVSAVSAAAYGLAGIGLSAAAIAASWAIVAEVAMRSAIGWIGLAAAVIILVASAAQALVPPGTTVQFLSYVVGGILFVIWFAWTALELRRLPSS
jgi:MFS family permease